MYLILDIIFEVLTLFQTQEDDQEYRENMENKDLGSKTKVNIEIYYRYTNHPAGSDFYFFIY